MPSLAPLARSVRSWLGACGLAALLAGPLAAEAPPAPGFRLLSPCAGDCAVAVYGGPFVQDSMADVLFGSPQFPTSWEYRANDVLLAIAASRRTGTILGRIDVEPEIGAAYRFGRQSEGEVWAAVFGRYRGFPWDRALVTTVAVSTGLNYAFSVTEVERDRARPADGDRLLHFFSPEITFALPRRPEVELMFRFHHRSGVFGLLSETRGGAHYGTVGLRYRF
jgi:hypothetical protein